MEPTLTLPVEGGYDLIQSYVNQEKQPGKQVKIPGRVTRPSRKSVLFVSTKSGSSSTKIRFRHTGGCDRVVIKKTFIDVEEDLTPTGLPATYNSESCLGVYFQIAVDEAWLWQVSSGVFAG